MLRMVFGSGKSEPLDDGVTVITVLQRWRQEDNKFEVSLGTY